MKDKNIAHCGNHYQLQ